MWHNLQETADLVRFTGEILNGKLHILRRMPLKMQFFSVALTE